MPIKNGDFVLIDYVLKVADNNEVFDVTMEDQAKAANVYHPDDTYEPKLVVVGQGWMIKGIDEALIDAEEGSEKDLEIPPSKAFGERDGSKVQIISARELTKQGITPRPGERIEVSGQLATIRSVGSGRVTIDYNHPLAGKKLVSKIYLRKIVSDPVDRIRELIHRRIRNVSKDKFMISNLGTVISVEMPEEAFTLEDIQFAKKGIAKEIGRYMPEVATVQFMESFTLKQQEKAAAKGETEKPEQTEAKEAPAESEKAVPEAESEEGKTESKARPKKKSQQP